MIWPSILPSVLGLLIGLLLASPSASEERPVLSQQVHEQLTEAQTLLEKKQNTTMKGFMKEKHHLYLTSITCFPS